MAITAGFCNSFRVELGQAIHDLVNDDIKVALYTSEADLDPTALTAYTPTGEVSGAGYTAGGKSLANKTWELSGTKAVFDADDVTWTNAVITARGALIYNATRANRAIRIIDFGSDVASTGGDWRYELPAATDSDALIRW
jgi:hypothetical protein